ncbi:MAG: Crp/Fnr family transcriptional regulator [Lentimicrobium sp.]|nr:Crp/Fnr family transcriptional regulator [Lentimicrobium sp.]
MDSYNAFQIEKFTSISGNILRNIPEEIQRSLERQLILRNYKKGQNIFLEGSFPAGVYILNKGLVKKYKTDHYGKQHIFSICIAGEMLGYSALLCNEPYPDSASAIETSELGFIPKEFFLKAVMNSNALMLNLMSSLSHEFGVMINSINVFAQLSVRERLAITLLILTEKLKIKPSDERVEICLSRKDLASIVGTATETLSRLLKELKKDGIIEVTYRTIVVIRFGSLIEMSRFV